MNELQTQNNSTELGVFNESAFKQMCQVSDMLAKASLTPKSLKGETEAATQANCLLVVEQSSRWGISPFAAMQCASVIHGKLMWEGKLVHGVLAATLGTRLKYDYEGEGENMSVIVSGKFPDEDEPRTIKGTVKDWKTSQWVKSGYEQRLAYRGAREWARRHAPEVMLGVITDDEILPSEPEPKSAVRDQVIDPFAKPESSVVEVEVEQKPEEPKAVEPASDGWRKVNVKFVKVEGEITTVTLFNGEKEMDAVTHRKDITAKLDEFEFNDCMVKLARGKEPYQETIFVTDVKACDDN